MTSRQIVERLLGGGVAAESFVFEHGLPATVGLLGNSKLAGTCAVAVIGHGRSSPEGLIA